MYQQAKQIMNEMLNKFERDGISDKNIYSFYLKYQINHWQKKEPKIPLTEIEILAQKSATERLLNPKRKRVFDAIKYQINNRHNDFMCEFFAMYLQQQLASKGIKSEIECIIDHFVLLEDGNCLFPGEEWGNRTCEELRSDNSKLFYLE